MVVPTHPHDGMRRRLWRSRQARISRISAYSSLFSFILLSLSLMASQEKDAFPGAVMGSKKVAHSLSSVFSLLGNALLTSWTSLMTVSGHSMHLLANLNLHHLPFLVLTCPLLENSGMLSGGRCKTIILGNLGNRSFFAFFSSYQFCERNAF